MMTRIILLSFLLFQWNNLSFSQRNVKDTIIGTPIFALHYGGNLTAADLKERYGYLNHVGGLIGYKTSRNWFWGLDANFIFGSKILMSDPLFHLRDSKGNITDENGDIAAVIYNSRGFNANAAFGKVLPVLSPNANSGIFIHGGAGILAHKLRIETNNQVVPPIEAEYRKGYDRLTMGLNVHQFVGYSYMSNRGLVNFYGGFYFQEGFTKNQRTINFDEPNIPVSTKTRLDIQYGFKLGWMIPIYKRLPKDYYFD
jgi:hypothetical protein